MSPPSTSYVLDYFEDQVQMNNHQLKLENGYGRTLNADQSNNQFNLQI